MKSHHKSVAILAAVGMAAASPQLKAQTNAAPKSVEERIDALEKELRGLKQQKEFEDEAATARKKDTPILTAGQDGFGFKSADDAFALRLGGLLQADSR